MGIAVYGAAGFLGRLVADRLAALGVEAVLVGRNREAIERLAASRPSTRFGVAPVDDAAALGRAFDGCPVVINCAPAEACGEPIVRATLAARSHYVDAAGEQAHIRRLFDTFSDEAVRRGVAILPAVGFDYAIGDCLARLAASSHEPAEEVTVAYSIEGSEVSGNSAQAAATTTPGQEVVYRGQRWTRVPFELDRASFDFPAPVGRRQMSRYGSGEVITVPRHTKTRSVRTLITAQSLCPHPVLLPIFPVLRPLIGLARRTPARAILGVAARLAARSGPTTPAVRDQPRRFMIAAEARGLDGSMGRAVAAGGDFHAITAVLLVQAAVWLNGGHGGGVFSAASAFRPESLLETLTAHGVRWSTDSRVRR